MRHYVVAIVVLSVLLGGCVAPTGESSEGASTTDDPVTTFTTTECRSILAMERVDEPDPNRSDRELYNYSELPDGKKEIFDDARLGPTQIRGDMFWNNVDYVRYDGEYYEPRLTYC